MSNQSSKKKELKVIIPQQLQGGVFSNVARISISPREVIIDFAFVEPNVNQAILVSRVILTREHAFELKNLLNKLLSQYEEKAKREEKSSE